MSPVPVFPTATYRPVFWQFTLPGCTLPARSIQLLKADTCITTNTLPTRWLILITVMLSLPWCYTLSRLACAI
ncbi:MAG: hypothetical protein ABI690_33450 [Chloroflexota bacterium]